MSDNKIILLSPYCETVYTSPNSSLDFLRYYLIDNGLDAEIIDCAKYDPENEEVSKRISQYERPIVGVTGYTRERFHAYRLIKKIRETCPDAIIITGGRHFGFLAAQTLENMPEVDYVISGDGELPFKEFCEAIIKGRDVGHIPGLSYRKDGEIASNPVWTPSRVEINSLRNYDKDEYAALTEGRLFNSKVDRENLYFNTWATRGCAFNCTFCSLTADKVRSRSVDSVLDEVEEKVELLGIRNFSFTDSSFTLNKKYVQEFCAKIIERNLNVRWNCYSRVDIDLDLLKLMHKAGLVSVEIAVESGSPRMLESIKKKIDIEQFVRFVKMAHELGIRSFAFFMMSFPDETPLGRGGQVRSAYEDPDDFDPPRESFFLFSTLVEAC